MALTTWAVAKYTTLKKLWLVDCRLKSSLNDFINELGSFSHLRLLDISGNDIGDLGINYLSKSLQVNRSLQFLMFDRSNVSVMAYTNIMEAIKRYIDFLHSFYLFKMSELTKFLKKIKNSPGTSL